MKHFYTLILVCLLAFIPSKLKAHNPETGLTRYYITLTSSERPGMTKNSGARIDMCDAVAAKAQLSTQDIMNLRKYRFPSLAEAMNFLSPYRWQLADVYTTQQAGGLVTVNWVIYKDVKNPLELSEGLTIEE